ncbi:4'-phosphopantetheinyl transferase superfamily protein [Xanthobacter sp. 91]|uniref:4'-phosphopantetheinyl transferase family protein n=1 Tax=Xanthobacter sp. 91 TaxID=1117244 RepID=UPI000689E29C|nr:4'-phosphopantetheinyl transferase superfamily protein [Xanthobacter sp. 91]
MPEPSSPADAARLAPGASLLAIARVADALVNPDLHIVLPPDEDARIARHVKADDRAARRAAWSLARTLLGAALGRAPAEVTVARGTNGRPELVAPSDIDFNLTHSGSWVAVGLARGGTIGVDVEKARGLDLWTRLAPDFMHDADRTRWSALPEADRAPSALRQWCGKEAVLKATGEGLAGDARGVRLPEGGGLVVRAGRAFLTGSGALPAAAYAFAVEVDTPTLFLSAGAGWERLAG